MFSETLLLTTAQSPLVSSATLFSAAIIAITMRVTIKPYSTAVAPRSSRKSFKKSFPHIVWSPEHTARWDVFSQENANECLQRKVKMENLPTSMLVAAAAIFDLEGRILLQQCPPGTRNAGQWEFPGGKVESEEIPRVTVCRELAEELGIALDPAAAKPAGFAEELVDGGRLQLVMLLYSFHVRHCEPESREGQDWGWFELETAASLPMPPMDRALLARLAAGPIAKPPAPAYVAPSKRARSSAG